MPRNLVICCDGTNNRFGRENTSVVRLVQVLNRTPGRQRLYYDPGVGTLPEPGMWNATLRWLSKVGGLAFGTGLNRNVEEAYAYLMDHWEPGDHVFMFGFSRGAYTVRVLAALLHTLGLLPRGGHNLVPYVMRLFASSRDKAGTDDNGAPGARFLAYQRLCDEFRLTFARVVPGAADPEQRRFPVRFMGVWDTVASVGWVWDPVSFPHTACNPSIGTIRHAIAIDERRAFFRQNRFRCPKDQPPHPDLVEAWFPGVHSDVGGGYPTTDGNLWRPAFDWMLAAAERAGLQVDEQRRLQIVPPLPPDAKPWADRIHESLEGWWWAAEYFPKLPRQSAGGRRRSLWPGIGRGRRRFVQPGALLHRSALLRVREPSGNYAPTNLDERFLAQVRALSEVPDFLAYRPNGAGAGGPASPLVDAADAPDVADKVAASR